uniref:Photosystem II reaction center protein M n=1 Tax=Pseudolarix amabilis TaxID=3355 RepID=A0A193PSM8_PSEAD|nr:photosystem II M protein [Pseudolarix amabilis]APC92981.1 PsbM [Pseudolarix amabilis]BAV19373.1 photosystem II M protein [Pseudolarix amabilis]
MEVNILGLLAVVMLIGVPTAFLLIPYAKTASGANSESN